MDKQSIEWRIFEDINMSDISTSKYDKWDLVPSGLNSNVKLVPVATQQSAMTLKLERLIQHTDGNYYPQYLLTLPTGNKAVSISLTTNTGEAFTGFESMPTENNRLLLTVMGKTDSQVIVQVIDDQNDKHYGYVAANGGYSMQHFFDFTDETALSTDGWSKMGAMGSISGFAGSGKQSWYRSKQSIKENKNLFSGLTFTSEKGIYYAVYPTFGLTAFDDATLSVDNATQGDLLQLNYLKGSADASFQYQVTDSLNLFIICSDTEKGLSADIPARTKYYIYRSAAVYRSLNNTTAIRTLRREDCKGNSYYSLQGVRILHPQKGIYIRNGRKVVMK